MLMNNKKQNTGQSEIIDVHCHAAGIGAGRSGCYISPAMRKSWKYRIYLEAFGVTEKEVADKGDSIIIQRLSEKLADSIHVDSAVVLAMDCVVNDSGKPDLSRTEIYVPNEFVSGEVQKYTNLYFGASINPYRKDAIERLDRAIGEKALLVKWLPPIQHIDPSDKRLIPFYSRMIETGLPLLTHTGDEHSFTRARNELADPHLLRLPLDLGVTVIAAHAATDGRNHGQSNFDRILPMLEKYPNLFADISSLTQINKIGHLQRLLRHKALHNKLLYGTDMPLLNTPVVSPCYFAFNFGLKQVFSLRRMQNPWDKDVRIKQLLGVPQSIFEKAHMFFADRLRNIKGEQY